MNWQSTSKDQKTKDSPFLFATGALHRNQLGLSAVNTDRPTEKQINKPGFSEMESPFNHDFSKIPANQDSNHPIQAKLKIGQSGDRYEQEADRVAEHVMKLSEPHNQSSFARTGVYPVHQSGQIDQGNHVLQPQRDGSNVSRQTSVQPIVNEVLHSSGQPLDTTTRQFMEPRFGYDFSQVRVHTDEEAASAAKSQSATAFAVGNHLVFGRGQFNPQTVSGQRLIAHELTHTLQQKNTQKSIQRKEDPSTKSSAQSAITLKNVIPFEKGDRITLNHLISEGTISLLKLAASFSDQLDEEDINKVTALLPDLVKRTGTLVTLTDDHAVIVVDKKTAEKGTEEITEKKSSEGAIDIKGAFTIELKRDPKKQTISIFVYSGQGKTKQLLGEQSGIKVSQADGGVKLSTSVEGTSVGVGIGADKVGDNLTVALSDPISAQLLSISRLPKVRAGSAEEKAAVTKAATSASESRVFKNFKIRGEFGDNLSTNRNPNLLFGASFQVNFRPIEKASAFFHLPLELQIQYAPPSSVIGAINSGAVVSLEKVAPINIRFITGIGGGSALGQQPGERTNVFGPTLGAGVGFNVSDSFSVDIRYQHLFNLIGDKVDSNVLSVGLSGRFGVKKDE